jgi:hypothetical protein
MLKLKTHSGFHDLFLKQCIPLILGGDNPNVEREVWGETVTEINHMPMSIRRKGGLGGNRD